PRGRAPSALPHGPPLDPLLARRDDEPVHVDPGRVDRVRVEVARLDELLDLRDADPPARRGHRVEVPRRAVVDDVPEPRALPAGDEREVADDALLEHAFAAAEDACLLALGDERARAGRRVERGDPGAAGAHPLGERALRHEVDLELAAQELALELGVLADV